MIKYSYKNKGIENHYRLRQKKNVFGIVQIS